MKIALIANNQHPVSIHSGFGVEVHVATLLQALAVKGHDITLFASGDSETTSKLVSVHPISTALDNTIVKEQRFYYERYLYLKAFSQADQFDIIHCHDPTESLFFSSFVATPTVSTVHSPWNIERYPIPVMEQLGAQNHNHWLIAISEYQKKQIQKNIQQVKKILHGIAITCITPNFDGNQQKMFFIGRVNKRKGIDIAIKTAITTNKPLDVVGFVAYEFEKQMVTHEILPLVSTHSFISYKEPVLNESIKYSLYSQSKLFLFPIRWEESFGLVMIESMATGTPVVAFARGSVPEVIKDGETGFIVNPSDDDIRGNWITKKTGIDGLCEAVERIYNMPQEEYRQMRKACRAHVEKNFTVERMVDEYERVYEQIIQSR